MERQRNRQQGRKTEKQRDELMDREATDRKQKCGQMKRWTESRKVDRKIEGE